MPRIRAETIEEHKELTRREILDAAAALFQSQGYTATNLADIAGYVGIGRTTLYEYFEDKEDILVGLVEESLPSVMEELVTGLPEDPDYRERLSVLIVRGLEFVSDPSNLGAMLMHELPNLSRDAQGRVRRVHGRLAQEMVGVCAAGIDSGEFGDFDPEDAGRLVYTLMMSASQSLMRSGDAKGRLDEAAGTLLKFIFDGLAA